LENALTECKHEKLHAIGRMAQYQIGPLSDADQAMLDRYDAFLEQERKIDPDRDLSMVETQRQDLVDRPDDKAYDLYVEARKARAKENAKITVKTIMGLDLGTWYKVRTNKRYPLVYVLYHNPDSVRLYTADGTLIKELAGWGVYRKSALLRIVWFYHKHGKVPERWLVGSLGSISPVMFSKLDASEEITFRNKVVAKTPKDPETAEPENTEPETAEPETPPAPKRKRRAKTTARSEVAESTD
jgi:hypothetical protein